MPLSNPLLSIVIPVYNVSNLLEDRLKLLLEHDLSDTQIIIINDGSTDDSYEICHKYLVNEPNTLLLSVEHTGLSAARNRGIQEATGEYILFLDSDDTLLPAGFLSLKEHLSSNKPDILMGKYIALQEKGRDIKPDYTFPKTSSQDEAKRVIYNLSDSIWNAWRYVCRREFITENELFFRLGILCEDMEWSPRILDAADSIDFLDEPFYGYYYNRAGSITQSALAKRIMDVNNIVSGSVAAYAAKEYGQALNYRLIRESFYCISRYFLCKKNERQELRPVMERAIRQYHYSNSRIIGLFLKTEPVIPLYIWSVSLWLARKGRSFFRPILGPTKALM